MRNFLLFGLLFILLTACGNSNKLFPKKHLGIYEGKQGAYEVSMNGEPITVPAANYKLQLAYGELWITTPKQKLAATYSVVAETKMYYSFIVHIENGVIEEWQLWKKGGRLIRKSIAPRPEVWFLKD